MAERVHSLQSFLGSLDRRLHEMSAEESSDVTWPVDHDPLFRRDRRFRRPVAAGEYFEGFGRDHEVRARDADHRRTGSQARYLRVIYEATPAGERASVLVEEWFDLPDGGTEVSLAAVREADART